MVMEFLQPQGWKSPKGFSNGIVAEGRTVFLAGQIGWDADQNIVSEDFVEQTHQALKNICTILAEANAQPDTIVRMTWYVSDKPAYEAAQREIGGVYRATIGNHYPVMTLIEVASLLEPGAKVEIEATAVLPAE